MKNISDTKINVLAEKYGLPLFVVSADSIKKNLKTFKAAFSDKYPKVVVAYSYKVNYLPGILDVIHKQGAWAEVASGFEYEIARKMHVPGQSIVFNGPYKKKEELQKAIDEGALVNADHFDEITQLEQIAFELGKTINIGIRLNMEVGIDQLPDRFGFNLDSGEAAQVVKRCSEKGLLNICCLHVHLTSYIVEKQSEDNIPAKAIKLIWPKDYGAYREASEKMVYFAKEIREKFGVSIEYLDMGGGFPTVDVISPYVGAIVEPIIHGINKSDLPVLILEPGRAIVSDAADLISTVVSAKDLSGGQRAVVVDAGINLLPTSYWKFQDIECLKNSDTDLQQTRQTIVYGPLCLQTDIVAKTKLSRLSAGDILLIKNVGAYNIAQSSTFIYPRPAVVLIDGKDIIMIKKREEINDLL